jgi:hypothetical protein
MALLPEQKEEPVLKHSIGEHAGRGILFGGWQVSFCFFLGSWRHRIVGGAIGGDAFGFRHWIHAVFGVPF